MRWPKALPTSYSASIRSGSFTTYIRSNESVTIFLPASKRILPDNAIMHPPIATMAEKGAPMSDQAHPQNCTNSDRILEHWNLSKDECI